MGYVRQCKVLMIIGLAIFTMIVTFTNLIDYQSGYEFIRHVMAMDTTFGENDAIYRAVRSPVFWTISYWLTVLGQGVTCGLFVLAAFRMSRALEAPAETFQRSKDYAVYAVTMGFVVWFVGITLIGGEWFISWQSDTWNGQSSAFRVYMTMLAVLIFVMQPDPELPARRRQGPGHGAPATTATRHLPTAARRPGTPSPEAGTPKATAGPQ